MLRLRVPIARPEWRPPVDYSETTDEVAIKIEVAGLAEDDFEILLYEDVIVIGGERRWRSSGEARFHLAEIRYGPFRLELPIPTSVNRERVTARYERGFLVIQLPKLSRKQ
jgi:HSP20 family molecular chaperone IbpA